jgi:hypothetical protein
VSHSAIGLRFETIPVLIDNRVRIVDVIVVAGNTVVEPRARTRLRVDANRIEEIV